MKKQISIVALLFIAFTIISCSQDREAGIDNFEVHFTKSSMGRTTMDITVNDDSLVGSVMNETIRIKLSSVQKGKLSSFLGKINLQEVKSSYVNAGVKDGWQANLEINAQDRVTRVHISNFHDENMDRLMELITDILPKKQ